MSDRIIRKLYSIDRAANPPSDTGATFIASTAASDRYGDIVDQTWKLDNYKENPVIQVDHDYRASATVGRGVMVEVVENKLMVDVKWGSDEQSKVIALKVKEGLLNAVSVGFRPGRSVLRSGLPTDHPYYSDGKENPYGRVYYDNDLLEVSVVAIPANAEALAQRGFSPGQLQEVAELVFQKLASAKSLVGKSQEDKNNEELADWLTGGK